MVGQGVGDDEEVRVRVTDFVRVHDLGDPFAQRRHVKAAVAHDVGHAAQRALELGERDVAVHEAAHFLVVNVHDLGKVNIVPDVFSLFKVVHDDHGAVERADGRAGHGGKADARQTIGFVTIQFQFHVGSPICRFLRHRAAGQMRPRRHAGQCGYRQSSQRRSHTRCARRRAVSLRAGRRRGG